MNAKQRVGEEELTELKKQKFRSQNQNGTCMELK
jgi:hypothetical protein